MKNEEGAFSILNFQFSIAPGEESGSSSGGSLQRRLVTSRFPTALYHLHRGRTTTDHRPRALYGGPSVAAPPNPDPRWASAPSLVVRPSSDRETTSNSSSFFILHFHVN